MEAGIKLGVARSVGVSDLPAYMHDAAVALARLERVCRALAGPLGLAVRPVQARTYTELVAMMDRAEVDVAWLPPVVALRATRVGLVMPLLAPLRGGRASFLSALFALEASPISGPEGLRGARVAWVDRSSAGGYAVIRAALRARGLDPSSLFSRESFEGSHRAVVQAVADGNADVGATYLDRDSSGKLVRAGWGELAARIVFEHGPIPADVVAAALHLDADVAARVQALLADPADAELGTALRELFDAEGLIPVDGKHLESLAPLLDHFDEP